MSSILSMAFALIFIIFLCVLLFLNIVGLPANWIILIFAVLWKFLFSGSYDPHIIYWIALFLLALLGEVLETGMQLHKAKRHGSSKPGIWGGLIGSVIGAILLAPFFFGLGAMLGAFLGAFAGCFLLEILRGTSLSRAREAAFGNLSGKFLGVVCKCGTGGLMVAIIAHSIWPIEQR